MSDKSERPNTESPAGASIQAVKSHGSPPHPPTPNTPRHPLTDSLTSASLCLDPPISPPAALLYWCIVGRRRASLGFVT